MWLDLPEMLISELLPRLENVVLQHIVIEKPIKRFRNRCFFVGQFELDLCNPYQSLQELMSLKCSIRIVLHIDNFIVSCDE